jgi:hypothetical protein
MFKKVLVLVLAVMMLVPTFVFADISDYPTPPNSACTYVTYRATNGGEYFYSNSPFYIRGTVCTTDGSIKYTYRVDTDVWVNYINVPYSSSITYSNVDLYYEDGTTLFLSAPIIPPALVQGMMGANLLTSILPILPIILGTLVLLIGFWKAWRTLLRMLSQA